MAPLVDTYGRVHRDCGSRSPTAATSAAPTACPRRACSGCREELLTYEEIERIARVLVERTGSTASVSRGEPTARAHLQVLVSKLAALDVDLALTTNGATFGLLADQLAQAGLRRVNVSLDSLR